MEDLRKLWPSNRLNAGKTLAAVQNITGLTERAMVPCPNGDGGNIALYNNVECACENCGSGFDLFEVYKMATGLNTAEAAAKCASSGLFKSNKKIPPGVLRSHDRHIASVRAFTDFINKAASRKISKVSGSPVYEWFRADPNHLSAVANCSTAVELDSFISGKTAERCDVLRELGCDPDTPIMVVSLTDKHGMVSGLFAAGALHQPTTSLWEPKWAYFGVYGANPGSTRIYGAGGEGVVVTFCPTTMVSLSSQLNRTSSGSVLDVVLTKNDKSAMLGSRRGTINYVVTDRRYGPRDDMYEVLALAASEGAHVFQSTGQLWEQLQWSTLKADVQAGSLPWEVVLHDMVTRSTIGAAGDCLRAIGWCPIMSADVRARGNIPVGEVAKLDKIAARHGASFSRETVEVRKGMTIEDSPQGWTWVEKYEIVCGSVPVITSVYRGADGRVRYRGYVRHVCSMYPFDSARFRKDPVAVIDAALVDAKLTPNIHPMIVPHIADLAMWFHH